MSPVMAVAVTLLVIMHRIVPINIHSSHYTLLLTRKPCCRKETARCRKCSFLLKFANNIHYKYKT